MTHNAENDRVVPVQPDDVLLALIRAADTLGHHLPWANAKVAWPGSARDLRYAAESLLDAGLIDVTDEGFRLALTCAEHDTRVTTARIDRGAVMCVSLDDPDEHTAENDAPAEAREAIARALWQATRPRGSTWEDWPESDKWHFYRDADTALEALRRRVARVAAEWLAAWDGDSLPEHYAVEGADLADRIMRVLPPGQETPDA